MSSILVVDDETEICHFLQHLLGDKGHIVTLCKSGEEFDFLIKKQEFDLTFLDIRLPDRNGLDILQNLRVIQPACKVIVMTGYSTVKTAVEAIKLGANDFIEKPFDDINDIEKLTEQLLGDGFAPSQNEALELANRLGYFIGENFEMKQLYALAYKFAKKNVTVLIEGETGTGKEVLAHYIHCASMRQEYPYIAVNCGAISENLLESELFGHTKGAFTGAVKDRKGYFEQAGKGTLFLDEIGEASLTTQVKLLRVLETGEFMKVGGELSMRSQARLIAASHVNLQQAVVENTFREDLLYRLDVVKLVIPPLRDRLLDIPGFIYHYFKKHNLKLSFSEESIQFLCKYQWPGNVRELVNVIRRAAALAEGETTIITPKYLANKILEAANGSTLAEEAPFSTRPFETNPEVEFDQYLKQWQQEMSHIWESERNPNLEKALQMIKSLEAKTTEAFIKRTLRKTIGNRKEAAELLGITQRKLRYFLNEKK
ncbi:sigma-54-dependent transcriptional regulator [Bacillus massilinigeriensis]|uniref:sigma-54-dependent transcriptional regulator n=1 Tax=Bacillus massilionigeriensis TaxID=1805475 RepID=UPI00096B1A0C|nr:sigma-54 dependent transcriptional regulator [Bacillus massilionigeriensis]